MSAPFRGRGGTSMIVGESLERPVSARETLFTWAKHLAGFAFPLLALAFVVTGPHRWFRSVPSLGAVALIVWADGKAGRAKDAPREDLPSWPFDLSLYALVALQIANLALWARMGSKSTLGIDAAVDAFVGIVVVGSNSG